ncbi:hypothetical protein GQ53DRAFT_751168 [Thozetella sp. PMI_491]|nr:hypothetical protein GQ53DRAFT_751168 [Thozetella sp. PMI_491]
MVCGNSSAPWDDDDTTAENLAKLHIDTWDNITNSSVHRFLKRFAISRRFPALYYCLLGILALGEDNYEDFCQFMLGDAGRCLARSRGGRLRSTPHASDPGDQIALLHGGRHPYVIREAGDRWELVGPCYFSREDMDELRVLWAGDEPVKMAFK